MSIKRLSYLLPAAASYGLIFYLSGQSRWPVDIPVLGFDKIVHLGAYAVLGGLLAFGFGGSFRWSSKTVLISAVTAGVLLGLLDEFHQVFVPGRIADPWDAAADALGAAAGVFLFIRWRKKPGRRPGSRP